MKYATGKSARAIRRREIISQLLNLSAMLPAVEQIQSARELILELNDIMVIEANQPTKPRRKRT